MQKYKIGDWVRFQGIAGNIIGKIIRAEQDPTCLSYIYTVVKQDIQYKKVEKDLQKYPYTHYEFSLGFFRFSFFKLGFKWSIRFEASHGWGE